VGLLVHIKPPNAIENPERMLLGLSSAYTLLLSMTSIATIMTADQLFAAGDLGRCELLRGELILMSPASPNHGSVASTLLILIGAFVRDHKLGRTYAAETGFILARHPDTVRAPDVAFVRQDRVHLTPKRGYFPGPPDLAVEVLSPDDTASEVLAKVEEWLTAGTVQVWIVDPERKTIAIHGADHSVQTLHEGDDLRSEVGGLLPGFRVPVAEFFQ